MSSSHSKDSARIGGIVGGFAVAFIVGFLWWWRRSTGRRCTDGRNGEGEFLLMSRMEDGTINAGKRKRNHVNGDQHSPTETEEEVHSPLYTSVQAVGTGHSAPKYVKQGNSSTPRTASTSYSNLPRPYKATVTNGKDKRVLTNITGPEVELVSLPGSQSSSTNPPTVLHTSKLSAAGAVGLAAVPAPLPRPFGQPPAAPSEQRVEKLPPQAAPESAEPDNEEVDFQGGHPAPAPIFPLYRRALSDGPGRHAVVVPYPPVEADSAREDQLLYAVEAECNTHWANTLATLEQRLSERQAELRALEQAAAVETVALDVERQRETRLRTDLDKAKSAEEAALQRLANLTAKFGESHVTRDSSSAVSRSAADKAFPSGAGVIAHYRGLSKQVEALAVAICATSGQNEATLIQQLILPVHDATAGFVDREIVGKQARMEEHWGPGAAIKDRSADDVAWQFFLFTQQPLLWAELRSLPDEDVEALLCGLGPAASQVRERYKAVDWHSLVRKYLELHLLARMSDPPCYVFPAPGARVAFQSGLCKELLYSEGSAPVREGAVVEVVLGGLCFEDPAEGGKPVEPLLVRRL